LAKYIGTNGKFGRCTDYYAIVQAARYLGCDPWELIDQSVYWQDVAHKCMTAEIEGQKIKDQRPGR
jgi:hypothetical protein